MVNDITIITFIVSVFIFTGVAVPFLNAEFGVPTSIPSVDTLEGEVSGAVGATEVSGVLDIGIFDVLLSVMSMFFWSFGALPFFLEAIFLVFRIVLVLTIARNIWIGGGG